MPRLNDYGEVALNFEGSALGARHLTHALTIFQQPVNTPDGPWQMAVRATATTGRGDALLGVVGGCNDLAAGGGDWMRRLDSAFPLLSGSREWWPSNGYVGDIDRDGHWLTISPDGLTLTAAWGSHTREDVQGGTRYMDGLACWTSRGRVVVYDWLDGYVPVQQVGPGAAWALAFRANGQVWVCYQTDQHGGVVHPANDASQGYRYGVAKSIYDPDVLVSDGALTVCWAADEGQRDIHRLTFTIGAGMVSLLPNEGQPLPPPVEPPVTPPPPTPAPEPLGITIDVYGASEGLPVQAYATYRVTGHGGEPVRVWLTLDGNQVAGSDRAEGRLDAEVHEPGEYRLGATVYVGSRMAQTGKERILRITKPAPVLPPVQTGRDGFTQAANESRAELSGDDGA